MIWKKRRPTIGRQVIIINVTLTSILLCILTAVLFYLNGKVQEETHAHNQQILNTISRNFELEKIRLANLSEVCRSDTAMILNTANQLGEVRLADSASEIGEKLRLLCYSLPYADSAVLYIRNTEKVITQSGAIYEKAWYLDDFDSLLSSGEELPQLDSLRDGFYTYEKFTLFVCNIFSRGSIIIQLNASKMFNLDEIHGLLPNFDILILNGQQVFASTGSDAKRIFEDLALDESFTRAQQSWSEGKYQITQQQIGSSDYRYVILGQNSSIQNQQLRLNLITILAAATIVVICFFVILLNARIYTPLQQVVRKIGNAGRRYEIDVINHRLEELMTENTQMNELINSQNDIQLEMALNYAAHLAEDPPAQLAKLLRNQFDSYQVVVVAAQGADGRSLLSSSNGDSYFADTLDGHPVHIDAFVHAYVISIGQEPPPPQEYIKGNFERFFRDNRQEDAVFVGISDVSGDVLELHRMFAQARQRMMAAVLSPEKAVSVCTEDSPAPDSRMVPLEIQNTLLECIRTGTPKDLEAILTRVFFSRQQTAELSGYLSIYQTLSSLLHVILSSLNVSEDVCASLKSVQAAAAYNPYFMFRIILDDFIKINQNCSAGTRIPKYQIIEYIQQHYREPLDLESIAAEFGITPVYLSAWFKKNVGINLSAHITNVRMEQAKRLLLEKRSAKVQDIAQEVGIPSISTFIRQFKNHTGTTPDQYRKLN